MKLVTYRLQSRARAGLFADGTILDLATGFAYLAHEAGRPLDPHALRDTYGTGVLGVVENAERALPAARRLLEMHDAARLPSVFDGRMLLVPSGDAELLAPIPRPPSMRDGYAFRQHVETARKNRGLEMIPEFDQFPVFYFTNHAGVIGPGPVAVREAHLERLDFELEAAIVVGKEARDVDVAAADGLIFGLTIMNDFSARALQMEEMKLSLGPAKGKDFATALGPWLVTLDELEAKRTKTPRGSHWDLGMRAFVNGTQVSRGNLKDMSWTFAEILARASYGVTLAPGDVVGSGTCGTGCFLELNGSKITKDQWLRPKDQIALEIDGLGRLENVVAPY